MTGRAPLKRLTSTLFILTLSLSSLPVHAEVNAHRLYLAARGDIPWQSLSPEEQRALQRHRGNWDDYDSKRQQDMRRGAQRYLELPADKRHEVEQQRRKYEKLSPQERQRLRKEYQRQRR
jgi:hypothetical protein